MGFGSTKYVEEKTILENLKDSSPLRQGGSFVNSSELSLFVIRHEITFSRGKEIYVKAWQKALETKVCVNRDVSSCAPVAIDQSCRAAAEI